MSDHLEEVINFNGNLLKSESFYGAIYFLCNVLKFDVDKFIQNEKKI